MLEAHFVVSSYVDSRSSTLRVTSAKSLSGAAIMIAAMFTHLQTRGGPRFESQRGRWHNNKITRQESKLGSHNAPCSCTKRDNKMNKEQGRTKRVPTVPIYVSMDQPIQQIIFPISNLETGQLHS